MKIWFIITLLILCIVPTLHAQQIIRDEYFFDSDPGFGNGTKTTFAPTDSINLTQNITLPATLQGGLHTLFVRVQDVNGTWSMPEVYVIYVQPEFQSLTSMEYFFDSDPGFGHGTETVLPPLRG